MAGNTAHPGASLVTRTFDVLGAFDDQHRRLGLAGIARRAGLSPATTLRIVRQLIDGGALERLPSGEYVVGRRLWDLGLLAPVETDLREVASPFLQDLHAATRATVHLAVREDAEVLYLDRLSGRASVPVLNRVGTRLPMHATGVGKVLLAHAPADIQARVAGSLTRVTPYSITSPGVLAEQLEKVRRNGWATTHEEMSLGACSVAVPVTVTDGGEAQVVAALGVVVPSLRRGRVRLVAALQVSARGIERSLSTGRG